MLEKLKNLMREAGIVGAGGAGFPSYGKLAPGADTLLINGAECEPLLHTDYEILRQHIDRVVAGAELIADALSIGRVILAVEEHAAAGLSLSHGERFGKKTSVFLLPNMYPMGDEITLIYQTTGRLVQPSSLPLSQGVIVYNVETVYNVYNALVLSEPLTEKWLTVGGDIPGGARVLRVPIGMRVSDLLRGLSIEVPPTHRLIVGGPSMGNVSNPETETVTKTTKGLLILPADIPAVQSKITPLAVHERRATSACCQCTRCTDMCPRRLLGYPLEPHRMVRFSTSLGEVDPALYSEATLCCGCGICELAACCQGLSPRAVIADMKRRLGEKRLRFDPKGKTFEVDPQRDYRLLPSARWRMLLGVTPYDSKANFTDKIPAFQAVEIGTRQHIGAPATPCVSVGDSVKKGTVVAQAADGLSIPQHAPIDGRVVFADTQKIVIEKV